MHGICITNVLCEMMLRQNEIKSTKKVAIMFSVELGQHCGIDHTHTQHKNPYLVNYVEFHFSIIAYIVGY